MSTRYVYDIYNTTVAQNRQTTEETLTATAEYSYVGAILCSAYKERVAYNRKGEAVTLYIPEGDYFHCAGMSFDGSGSSYGGTPYVADTIKYKYIIFYRGLTVFDGGFDSVNSSNAIFSECYLLAYSASISGAFWHTYTDNGNKSITVWNSNIGSNTSSITSPMPFYKSGGTIAKGSSLLKTESSATSKTAGAFSESGTWKWRVRKGSDNIDPTAVSYSKKDLYPGEPVTITVTPRTPIYGGTIYYLYQYSTNGGNTWTSIGSRTTETSATVTIPEGVEQFQARVLASDGWGFTSTTYVYGPSLGVSQLKAYATLQGVNRSLSKAYATIGRVVREISKGYVTVDGRWKKLF